MLTFYGFGPAFCLPDPSPFVMKSEVQLKMAGVPYKFERAAPPAAHIASQLDCAFHAACSLD